MGLRNLFRRKKKVVRVKKAVKTKEKAVTHRKKVARKRKVPKKKGRRVTRKKAGKEAPVSIDRNECPECGSINVVISQITGNTICQDCGAILAGLPPELEKKFVDAKKQS